MKKAKLLLFVVSILINFVACSDKTTSSANGESKDQVETEQEKVFNCFTMPGQIKELEVTLASKKNPNIIKLHNPTSEVMELRKVELEIIEDEDTGMIATYEGEEEENSIAIYITNFYDNNSFDLEIDYVDGRVKKYKCNL